MVKFFKGFWAALSFTRNLVLNLLFLIIVVAIVISVISAPKIHIPNNTAIHVAPMGILVEQKSYTPSLFDFLQKPQIEQDETVVYELVSLINDAADDKRITGMALQLDYLQGGGLSKLTEVAQALENFKAQGKRVVAYADSYTQQQFYLASFADTIFINELGNLYLTGYGMYRDYYKDAADKLKIKFHTFRVGDYKDAIEPYIRNSMSDESREHNSRWINELWGRYTSRIETLRGLPSGAIDEFITEMPEQLPQYGGSSADYAKAMGLVDGIVNRTQLKQQLIEIFGKNKDGSDFASVSQDEYLAARSPKLPLAADNIGLIVASGVIYDGVRPAGNIGGDSLSELIRIAREDDSLKALIIRVDSGGGSAFASEIIRQEILATRSEGLPVYISMGSVAASGGYWLATAADEIWATPATITGSIGVWGLIPNVSESLQAIGVHSDGIGTSPLADVFQLDRPLSEEAQKVFQSGVDNIYKTFLEIVAESRSESIDHVHSIAQGRVWTGATAKELNLVDNLGNLSDVIAAVVEQQKLDKKQVKVIQRPLSFKEQIFEALMQETSAISDRVKNSLVADSIGNYTPLKKIHTNILNTMQLIGNGELNLLARCFSCVAP